MMYPLPLLSTKLTTERNGISVTGSALKKSKGLLASALSHRSGPARRARWRRHARKIVGPARAIDSAHGNASRRGSCLGSAVCSMTSPIVTAYRRCVVLCLPHHSAPAWARQGHLSPGCSRLRILTHCAFIPTLVVVISTKKSPGDLSRLVNFGGCRHQS